MFYFIILIRIFYIVFIVCILSFILMVEIMAVAVWLWAASAAGFVVFLILNHHALLKIANLGKRSGKANLIFIGNF